MPKGVFFIPNEEMTFISLSLDEVWPTLPSLQRVTNALNEWDR